MRNNGRQNREGIMKQTPLHTAIIPNYSLRARLPQLNRDRATFHLAPFQSRNNQRTRPLILLPFDPTALPAKVGRPGSNILPSTASHAFITPARPEALQSRVTGKNITRRKSSSSPSVPDKFYTEYIPDIYPGSSSFITDCDLSEYS
jgi:hypothetical protein